MVSLFSGVWKAAKKLNMFGTELKCLYIDLQWHLEAVTMQMSLLKGRQKHALGSYYYNCGQHRLAFTR